MKVAIVVNELDIRGGTHKQVLRLSEFLINNGNDVTIYTKKLDLDKTYPEFRNIPIVCIPFKEIPVTKKGMLQRIKNKFKFLRENKEFLKSIPKDVDVINFHDQNLTALIYYAKRRCKKAKIIWQINDLAWYFYVGASYSTIDKSKIVGSNRISRRMERFFARRAAKKCDRITVNVTKNKLRVEEHLKCSADVLYCGVDVNSKLKMHTYPTEGKTIKLLSTGVFFPYRNYESLILAVEKLTNDGVDVRLDIIGSTKLDEKYATSIAELVMGKNLSDKVKIWGQVDEDKYNELYNEANVFMFLNIDQSWGLAVFEAMSCGIPVLVSNSVGAIELLNNNEDALIIEPKDIDEICNSVKRLINDKDFYEAISQNAAEAVKSFTWEKLYSEKMYNLFQEL